MITHCGWSVQLYLHNTKLTPFDVQTDSFSPSSLFASYAVPSLSLSLGTEWYLIWRDDRPSTTQQASVVGLIHQIEGQTCSNENSLVGSSISPQSTLGVYPSVKGIVRMGIAPLKLRLVLREGQASPVLLKDSKLPLATFELVIYPEAGTKEDINGPVNPHGSQSQLQEDYSVPPPPSVLPAVQTALYSQSPPQPSTSASAQLSALSLALSQSRSEVSELSLSLEKEQNKSNYFEDAVSTLYNRFSPLEEVGYLDHRLRNESLAPHIRVAVAIARDQAREKLERKEKEGRKREIERFIAKLSDGEGRIDQDESGYRWAK